MSANQRPAAGTSEGLAAAGVFVDIVSTLKAVNGRLERKNTILLCLTVLLSVALLVALPLKKVVPFFYEVDSSTGRVSASGKVAEELRLSDRNVAYFLRLWATRVVIINAATLKQGLPGAYRWTRGSAAAELDNWIDKVDQTAIRIGKTPGLTREILGTPVVSFNEDRSVAFIDFVSQEKVNGLETERRRKLMTVEFTTLADKSSPLASQQLSDDQDNPLGLVITHFTINDQVSK